MDPCGRVDILVVSEVSDKDTPLTTALMFPNASPVIRRCTWIETVRMDFSAAEVQVGMNQMINIFVRMKKIPRSPLYPQKYVKLM